MAARLARLALRYGWTTLALVLLFTLAVGVGMGRLRSTHLEGMLEPDDPEILHHEALKHEFGSEEALVLALGCGDRHPCDHLFEPAVLDVIRILSERAEATPGVEGVVSLTNSGVLVGDGASLRVEGIGEDLHPPSVDRFRSLVASDPLIGGSLLSEDERTTAIIVRFDSRLSDSERNALALTLSGSLQQEAASRDFVLHASGAAMWNAIGNAATRRDLGLLTPVMVALLALILFWVFRDLFSVVLALLVVGLPTSWAFGLMGWLNRPITPVIATLPILILVVGVTDAVHFLIRVHDLRMSRDSLTQVVRDVAEEVGPPTTVTAVTSALGFLSFLAAPIPNFRDFGVFAAVGILGAWILTFALIPVALTRLPLGLGQRVSKTFLLGDRILETAHQIARQRSLVVLFLAAAAIVVGSFGISRIVVENDVVKMRGGGDPVVQAERFMRDRLWATDSLEVVLRAKAGKSLLDAESVVKMEKVEAALAEGSRRPVISVLPALRIANRELGEGSARVPRDRAATHQLLLLVEAADPDAVSRVITRDHGAARFSTAWAWGGSLEIERDTRRLRERLAAILDDGVDWFVTGSVVLNAHMGDLVLESQVASFSTALLTITAVVFFFIRSVPLGILGMIPNVLPIVVILGFMGFAGINLDVGTAMIASILIGVSVDDTIYFLLHYRESRRAGAAVHDAVGYTFAVAGKPALFCAAMLALGFAVLAFSKFQTLAIFGLLSAVAVLLAAVSELFVMPALLEVTAARRERR